jgi:nicotinamidase-related amidase
MKLSPKETAVVTLDFQKGLLNCVPSAEKVVPNAVRVVEAARKNNVRVIHVGLGFSEGHPEIPDRGSIVAQIRQYGLFVKGTESAEFLPAIAQPNELKIYKQRFSGFSDSTLDMFLRANGIKNLVLMGITTSGVVLSTLRRAADLDFSCTVIKDACYDGDEEVHRVLTEKVFAAQEKVTTAAELDFEG